jgi:hypothetical protein
MRLSCLRCLCLFACNGVWHVLCVSPLRVPYFASFSGLFFCDCLFGFIKRLIHTGVSREKQKEAGQYF